ncbi:hypothetical protein QTP88_012402 [Uroleucon formosanum]
MAGKIGGVQTKCKEQNSNIKYIHCYAHCLNLALDDSVCDKSKNSKRNKLVFNFFGIIQFTYNFIESSAMRHAILEKISKDVEIKLLTLKSCSITRWACRAEAVKSVLNDYEVLLLAIEEICESSSVPEMCAKGMGLKQNIKFSIFFETKKNELKITVYNQLLDELISGINSRFNQEIVQLVQAVASMIRLDTTPVMISILSNFANVPVEKLQSEIKLLKYLPATDDWQTKWICLQKFHLIALAIHVHEKQ